MNHLLRRLLAALLVLAMALAPVAPTRALTLFDEQVRYVAIKTSGEVTASGNTSAVKVGGFRAAFCVATTTAFTGGNVTAYIQGTGDNGSNFASLNNNMLINTTGSVGAAFENFGDTIRAYWSVSNATATFAIDCVLME